MMETKLNDNAAFEAQMMAAGYLESGLGRTASAAEVACVLAKAYGDALVAGINTLAQDAYRETLEAVAGQSCEATS